MVAASSATKLADFKDVELGGHAFKVGLQQVLLQPTYTLALADVVTAAQVNTLDWNCTGDCLASGGQALRGRIQELELSFQAKHPCFISCRNHQPCSVATQATVIWTGNS